MRYLFVFIFLVVFCTGAFTQTPKTYTSSEILLQLKKLNVLGSVLYIAAHPDDENTRLLAYLANEKLYRTGYLSLTRGDGGQNLIGDEQGIDLGLIRTQELLAARRIDGAEQFFSRAYDFGYCKTPEEALSTWGHDKILSDAVWVIRKFKPDVIIARFPEDARAGHGHHAASGILAREAYDAAADPAKFPEQLTQGVTVWQAKRMLWNTFNFGGASTQREDQFKTDVGMYNPLLGKSYGEIAALSRSQHRSQGFGVPAQRGSVIEYFETIKGNKPTKDLFDEIDISWGRIAQQQMEERIKNILEKFDIQNPSLSLKSLTQLYAAIEKLPDSYWKEQKQKELLSLIENCSGLFLEATANSQYAVQGDTIKISVAVNNRLGINISNANANFNSSIIKLDSLKTNNTVAKTTPVFLNEEEKITEPYWLENAMEKGSFTVSRREFIGKAENDPISVNFSVTIEGQLFNIKKPLRYKYTDPVKGEIYQPVYIVPKVTLNVNPSLNLSNTNFKDIVVVTKKYRLFTDGSKLDPSIDDYNELSRLQSGGKYSTTSSLAVSSGASGNLPMSGLSEIPVEDSKGRRYHDIREIDYDHIPSIKYFKDVFQKVLFVDLKTTGKTAGYIAGAGDKVPQALEQMGYKVTMLKEADITSANIRQFDVIVTGVRAYNTNDWMSNVFSVLMRYVNDGGVLLVQYNTNNFISNVKGKIGPYPFSISRNRVTDETAKVNYLLPNHPALNYPNKITDKDFEGWIQERSVYDAEKIDSNYQRIISIKDTGEKEDDGSLVISNYGKGKFIYTGLAFFRELPAGVGGAYRLFANLLAAPVSPASSLKEGTLKFSSPKGLNPSAKNDESKK